MAKYIGIGTMLIYYTAKGLSKNKRKCWTARWEYDIEIYKQDTIENLIKLATMFGWNYRIFRTHRNKQLSVIGSRIQSQTTYHKIKE